LGSVQSTDNCRFHAEPKRFRVWEFAREKEKRMALKTREDYVGYAQKIMGIDEKISEPTPVEKRN